MPGTDETWGRSSAITCSMGGRSARGLSRMKIRPVLGTTFDPLAPMKDMNCPTCGFFLTISATSCCLAIIAS